jgi:hypothetical protein
MANRAFVLATSLMVVLAAAWPSACRAVPTREFAPCSLLGGKDVSGLTAWHLETVHGKRYAFNGATGAMCFYEAKEGTVIVIVPDRDSPFPGDSPFSDPGSEGMHRRDHASGIAVTYYNGTAYMTVGHNDLAVRVVPTDHIASYFEVEPFAERLIAHAQRYRRGR